MSVHIERDGTRVVCDEESCDLPIHLPVDTVEEANALPSNMLFALIEVVDPPHEVDPLGRWRADGVCLKYAGTYGLLPPRTPASVGVLALNTFRLLL